MNPRQLSEELRNGSSDDLKRRRWIIGLSLLGSVAAQVVSMFQTGIIKRLPDPPLDVFDSDKVDSSDYAYKRLDTPDGLMMLTNYGLTACLAGAGGENRAAQHPLLPIAMGIKTVIDSVTALKLAQEEWKENQKLCAYCQVATLGSLASVVLAAPEVITAVKNLTGRRQ